MKTEIYIWSANGVTPVTKRGGAYCDVLLHTDVVGGALQRARALVLQANAVSGSSPILISEGV